VNEVSARHESFCSARSMSRMNGVSKLISGTGPSAEGLIERKAKLLRLMQMAIRDKD
jgi:hypothetical protein